MINFISFKDYPIFKVYMSRNKRINNEINKYLISGKEDELSCWLVQHETTNMIFYMNVTADYYVKISIDYPKQYPFRTPKVVINGYKYMTLLKINDRWKLNYIGNKRCLCCSSFICGNNWCATLTTVDLLKEIKDNLKLKLRFNEIAHVKKIKAKYLNHDIPIEEFL